MVSEKKIFEGSLAIYTYDTLGLIGRIDVGDHYTSLHTQYISCGPHGFREDFFKFFTL